MKLVTWVIYPAFEPQVECDPTDVLARLAARLVVVELVGGKLTLTGPEHVVDDKFRSAVRARHGRLVEYLQHEGGRGGKVETA